MRLKCLFVIIFTLFSTASLADQAALKHLPNAAKIGEGRLSVMIWDVYDATLYASGGVLSADTPFALSLRYLRDLKGSAIADRSVKEMQSQGLTNAALIAQWGQNMAEIFPDVRDQDTITGVFLPGKGTLFYLNGAQIGMIEGDAFLQRFSGIWLSENTSQPELRQQLLGR